MEGASHLKPVDEVHPAPSLAPSRALVGRFGSFFLTVPHGDERTTGDLLGAVVAALLADSRVLPFEPPKARAEWDRVTTFYPANPPSAEEALRASDGMSVVKWSRPLRFTVHVLTKNQPIVQDWKKIPAEDYYVLWNGTACMVFWEQDESAPISRAGGHVVKDVMSQAALAMDAKMYFQGCEPGCELQFGHTGVRVLVSDEIEDPLFRLSEEDDGSVDVVLPSEDDASPERITYRAFMQCSQAILIFATMKNMAQRLRYFERIASRDLVRMLGAQYRRSESRRDRQLLRHPVASIGRSWALRGWRRDTGWLMDRLWVTVAHIEQIRRYWEMERFRFREETTDAGSEMLFRLDTRSDDAAIPSLRVDTVQSALNEMGGRMTSWSLVRVTGIVGACALAAAALTVWLDRLIR